MSTMIYTRDESVSFILIVEMTIDQIRKVDVARMSLLEEEAVLEQEV